MFVASDWIEENFEIISDQDPCEDFYQFAQDQSAVTNHSNIRSSQMDIISAMVGILESKSNIKEPNLVRLSKT